MKPWLLNTIIIILGLVLIFTTSSTEIYFLIGLLGSIWVYFDAKKIHIEKYQKSKFTLSEKAGWTALIVFFFWIIALPIYLSLRYRILHGQIPLK